MINNIFSKRETKERESDVDIDSDPRKVIYWVGFSCEDKPIGVTDNANQRYSFAIPRTGDRSDCRPRWLLDENYVKVRINLENSIDNEIILSNILWKDLSVFQNHIATLFIAEQIEVFQFSWSLAYSLECYSLLNLYFQNGQSVELAWCLSLQFKHLKEYRHGIPFLVSNLGGLILLFALQHHTN